MMRVRGIILGCSIAVFSGVLLCWAVCARELLPENRWFMSSEEASEERFANQIEALRRGKGSVGLYDMVDVDEKVRRLAAIVQREQFPMETLSIMHGDASNESIAHAADVPGLRELVLVNVDVDGQGMRALSHAPTLERLAVVQTSIDSKDLKFLNTCSHLRSLTLYQSWPLSIDAKRKERYIAALCDLNDLEKMQLGGNWLSDADIEELRRAMPEVEITRLMHSPY